jgi:biopolymer transport protein ExbD
MKVNLHTPVEEVQIQIIPLIDVVFCILTFFLLAALQFTRQQAISVDLPKASSGTASSATAQSGRKILPVTIDAVGQTYVEKQPIKREQLGEILKQYLQQNPNGVLVLNASRSATYNDVIETLDVLRQVGGDRVSLGIIPGSTNQPINSPGTTSPSFPANPGAPGALTAPIPPTNQQGSPNVNFPQIPSQPQPGAGVNPANPANSGVVAPGLPSAPTQQAPAQGNPAPLR